MGLEDHLERPADASAESLRAPGFGGFSGLVGVARTDITPPIGIYARNWGAARHDVAESIHRPLTLTALTLQTDEADDPLVLIDVDLGWWRTLATFHRFRKEVLTACGLRQERFFFALSHTHAAVTLSDDSPPGPGRDLVAPYLANVCEQAIACVQRARESAAPATLEWQYGRCGLASTRDLTDPTSPNTRVVCGYDPSVAADDTLLFGRLCDSDNQVRATLVNYACHPTTLAWDNRAISPDYVGAMRATIEQATNGAPALFLQGASGELAPRLQYVGDTDVADRHGQQLACAALATLHDMEPPAQQLRFDRIVESGAPLAVWDHETVARRSDNAAVEAHVTLSLKDWPSAAELEAQRAACTDRALAERLLRRRDVRRTVGDGATFDLPIHLWRVGDAVLIGCLAESYSVLQQSLRRRFPRRAVACINLLNGSIGYLPPAGLYDQDLYQVWQTPFARGSLEKVITAMTRLIAQVTEDTPVLEETA